MPVLYLDTSALLKRYVLETGSLELQSVWNSFDFTGAVRIVQVEMAAALAKGQRMGWLSAIDAQKAWSAFLEDWRRLTLLEANAQVVYYASELAWTYPLCGYDSVHLAAAIVWQDGIGEPVTLATFDRVLWQAAKDTGLTVWPKTISS
jgi:predicted nucleic acid-binding protein